MIYNTNKLMIAIIIATTLFIFLTFSPLFNHIDNLLTNLIGHKLGNNIYIVILILTIIIGILVYLYLLYIDSTYDCIDGSCVKKSTELKNDKELQAPLNTGDLLGEKTFSEDKLEAFDVGGSLTCKLFILILILDVKLILFVYYNLLMFYHLLIVCRQK